MADELTPEAQNAYEIMKSMLAEWGLESLADTVYDFLIQGYSQDNIGFLLRDTDAYKQRFAGNELRRSKGLAVLSPAEYLSVERSYRQIMSTAGVPEGFYDQKEDFTKFIGNDMSPMELQRRVDVAQDTASKIDDTTNNWFREQYGLDFSSIDRGNLVAYVLDPAKGMDHINRVMRGGSVAGAARGRGLNISKDQAERFGAAADESQYQRQSAQFAEYADRGGFLSGLYHGVYDLETAGEEVFLGDTAAEQERRRLQARERAEFGGGGAAAQTGLSKAPGGY